MQSIFSYFKKFKSDKNNLFVTKPNINIYVAISSIHGRGVFAQQSIKPGTVIEECPIIKMKLQEMTVRKQMLLNYYAFMIDEQHEYTGIALGYGSLYNHANNCNATYYYNKEKELMIFEAIQPIAENQEITINYLGPDSAGQTIENWIEKPNF
ncbi:SET domain-containing protein-lysine N-methyltransferase [Flavobacterium sp.]|uniref:SET domain-containing protein-lysine N-methyltransferase n=1 Tax=Flavobacterium sp. TaxID=239 RepID=UPI001B72415E|nr:SET domain-containing protein-lysine N-methyltransferase [Flavobacterium sp.]MBP6181881.1 SET domain-containing protein-lysine N-methyltransferase [Flavobacterium sp.]